MALVLLAEVTSEADTGCPDVAKLGELHEAKARAELRQADVLAPGSDVVAAGGTRIADIAIVKGLMGPAEAAGGAALSGPDGEAAIKALERLGHRAPAVFFTLSCPDPSVPDEARTARIRLQIEAVGAELVVAVDDVAAADVAAAFGVKRLGFGSVTKAYGRRLLAVDGLEASLGDEARKRRVWRQLAPATPPPPVY